MNYFELFDIPVSLLPDKTAVRNKYLALSRQYHPDFHTQSEAHLQEEALNVSATINKAFKTFTNPDASIKYVLQLKGLLTEDEKYNLSPGFLMEMMEINETLSEGDENGKHEVVQQLAQLEKELYAPVADIIENYREGITTTEALLQVKDYYFKKKYLARIHEGLGGMS